LLVFCEDGSRRTPERATRDQQEDDKND
jgi:hypothetical protein